MTASSTINAMLWAAVLWLLSIGIGVVGARSCRRALEPATPTATTSQEWIEHLRRTDPE